MPQLQKERKKERKKEREEGRKEGRMEGWKEEYLASLKKKRIIAVLVPLLTRGMALGKWLYRLASVSVL